MAASENWLVVFDHEPDVPWGHVKTTSEGKFDFIPLSSDSLEYRSVHPVTLVEKK
jgi:hypothetical protein